MRKRDVVKPSLIKTFLPKYLYLKATTLMMFNKEQAFQKISNLTERFEDQIATYKKPDYNETLIRRDYIDPFFKALGWDVDNSQGYFEAYREVIHEDRVKVSGKSKAPDYSFR